MSAHLSRGIFQSATYVYSAGFSFTSDICAPACPAQPADIVNAHTAAKPFHTFPFMSFFLRKLGQIYVWYSWPIEVYRLPTAITRMCEESELCELSSGAS